MRESILYYSLKFFGYFVRLLPLSIALSLGKIMGFIAYYVDLKHRTQAYSNIKLAFQDKKTPVEIKKITKKQFIHLGQNLIDLLRLPHLDKKRFEKYISISGLENIDASLKKGKGVVLLAMHFGSWELVNVSFVLTGYPYKVFVKPQEKFSKLDDLLNEYRECGGSVVLTRGAGTRDLIKSLQNNEIIGMVVDQGGRRGKLVPFFNRQASMSIGALRMALKSDIPICFSVIIRDGNKHKLIIEKPLEIEKSGDIQKDLETNLKKVTQKMEGYIRQYPHEYMWMYKIWKYSKESSIVILSDSKVGHLRQTEAIAGQLKLALGRRDIVSKETVIEVRFKNKLSQRLLSFFSLFAVPTISQGRMNILKWFLTEDSYNKIVSVKADYVISCGSSVAGINTMLSRDQMAKSIVNLTPGMLPKSRYDLVVLPQHDIKPGKKIKANVAITKGAPNLINEQYLEEQGEKLLRRYNHLKGKVRLKIGVFVGGSAKNVFITEKQIRVLIQQLKEVASNLNADIMITTSRRTPHNIENAIKKELKRDGKCILCIIANEQDAPEAMGGILDQCDITVVSGDSISMISECASSGKQTVVFLPKFKEIVLKKFNKHKKFIKGLDVDGYILAVSVNMLGRTIYDIAKNKMNTKPLNDNETLFKAVKKII